MSEILVLGAGMVGVSTALALQERGATVTLMDRREPGLETTYGNAGIIQREAVEPYNIPHDLVTLFLYGIGRTNDISYRMGDLPQQLPALFTYYRNSGESNHRAISKIYEQLAIRVTDDHQPLIKAADADHLVRRNGFLTLCRTNKAFDEKQSEVARLTTNYDVPARMIDAKELALLEPALKANLAGAAFWTDSWSTSDPGALTAAYADLFKKRGGRFVKGNATTLRQTGSGWQAAGDDGLETASDVVIALGPWAPDILAPFGYRIMMVYKRGYHSHFAMDELPNRPIHDFANGVVYSPMQKGLRIATGAELVNRQAPENPKQLLHGLKAAREIMQVGEEFEGNRWFGNRPCMPDMLPLVGAATKHKGLWFHFGHGHQGLTQGPTTAHILADVMDGKRDALSDALAPQNRTAVCF
ncbi:FAD-binding oxidoreductase [uncultured Cohaesibacter sp.]|uniref:NAD(P)/FAD-dependent oxidoreductase n=1 Tax=uncultured Cohaesibacter sp. TaxID=1002546 RepID=UPI0029315FA8|nr:FAD-binding oxidoreductase [uncultured Cohaesibacter sp.]